MAAATSSAQFAQAAGCFGRWVDNENNDRAVEQDDGADETQWREHEDRAQALAG